MKAFEQRNARTAANVAYAAEQAGWDGFFVWEPVWGIDAWMALAATAMQTERIRLGTLLTPVSRMRPWKLASETVTLDHLSNGRVILSVGLGTVDTGFAAFGDVTDRKTRAELRDEGLAILTGLVAALAAYRKRVHQESKHEAQPGYQVHAWSHPMAVPSGSASGWVKSAYRAYSMASAVMAKKRATAQKI